MYLTWFLDRVSAVAWHVIFAFIFLFVSFFLSKNHPQVFVFPYLSSSQTLGLTSVLSVVLFKLQYVMIQPPSGLTQCFLLGIVQPAILIHWR